MRYAITHTTTYTYDDQVSDSLGVARLVPRSLSCQQVEGYDVVITPEPGDRATDLDFYGNHVTYFQVTKRHEQLVVTGTGQVDVQAPAVREDALVTPWPALCPLREPGRDGAWAATDFALVSALVEHEPAAIAYAGRSLTPGRPVGEAVTDLMHRVHADFTYDKAATTVTSTVGDILERRAGVCQDFAHLMLACLRGHGLAARYVSGYLATVPITAPMTVPLPGQGRLVGADASHAWVAVWLGRWDGEDVWLGLDPTNDTWVDERYVSVAWGRDYADVPPLKGVIFTEASSSTMQVSVDVAPLET